MTLSYSVYLTHIKYLTLFFTIEFCCYIAANAETRCLGEETCGAYFKVLRDFVKGIVQRKQRRIADEKTMTRGQAGHSWFVNDWFVVLVELRLAAPRLLAPTIPIGR